VLVVMDQFTRYIIGFGVHAVNLKRSGNENCCSNILQMFGMNPATNTRVHSAELLTISLNFHGLPRVVGDATH